MKSRYWLLAAVLVVLMLSLRGVDREEPGVFTPPDSAALNYWAKTSSFPAVASAEEDINGDGRLDTVLIYRIAADKCQICVILEGEDGFMISASSRAPVENQSIKFKDIDNKLPIEIIVSGSKKGRYGYGILRLEGNQLIDLFGEGMDECC